MYFMSAFCVSEGQLNTFSFNLTVKINKKKVSFLYYILVFNTYFNR